MEECEEEEIIIESEDDDEDNAEGGRNDRSITPTPIQDFGANVVYTEGKQRKMFFCIILIQRNGLRFMFEILITSHSKKLTLKLYGYAD